METLFLMKMFRITKNKKNIIPANINWYKPDCRMGKINTLKDAETFKKTIN